MTNAARYLLTLFAKDNDSITVTNRYGNCHMYSADYDVM